MGTPEQPDLAAGLIDALSRDADAAQVADRLEAFCADIDAVLSPILGRRGVAALMHRSLRVASVAHPWLMIARREGHPTSFDPAALTASVLVQDFAAAAAGAGALIRTFCDLVASLIGPSLTERLLGPILSGATSAPPVPGHIE